MFQRFFKICAVGLLLISIFTAGMPVYAVSSDIKGHWASAEITKWMAKGVFLGNPDGTFKPDNFISKAEFITVINRVFGYTEKSMKIFSDVAETSWYANDVSKAVAAGVIVGDGSGRFNPRAFITRQEVAAVLCRAFDLKAGNENAVDRFSDAKDVAAWGRAYMSALAEQGFIAGRPGNKLAPKENLTRAECAKLINNIAGELKNAAGTYTGTVSGNLTVNTASVILKDMFINGDLYLTKGIGDGNITLDNVTVKGRTIVRGGGDHSIILKNTRLQGDLLVIKQGGKIRIVAQGTTEVSDVQLGSGAILDEENLNGGLGFENVEVITIGSGEEIVLDGDFDEVTVESADADINLQGGTIQNLTVQESASGVNIQLAQDAVVAELTANAAADIGGNGQITTAIVNSNGVVIESKPTNLNVTSGVTATVGGETVQGTPPSSGGGSAGNPPGNPPNNPPNNPPGGNSITVSNIALLVSGGTANNLDLTGVDDTARLSGISFVTNANETAFQISGFISSKIGTISSDKILTFTSNNISISILDLLGADAEGHTSISLKTLRNTLGSELKVTGNLRGTGAYAGYSAYNVSVTITLGANMPVSNDTDFPYAKDWAVLNYDSGSKTLTADIIDSKAAVLLSTLKSRGLNAVTDLFGAIPDLGGTTHYIRVFGPIPCTNWYTDADAANSGKKALLKADLISACGITDWDTAALSQLRGLILQCKKDLTGTTYYYIKII